MKKNVKNLLFISSSMIAGSFIVASMVSMNPFSKKEMSTWEKLSVEPKVKITMRPLAGEAKGLVNHLFVPWSIARNMESDPIAKSLISDYWKEMKMNKDKVGDLFFFDKWIQKQETKEKFGISNKQTKKEAKKLSSKLANKNAKSNVKSTKKDTKFSEETKLIAKNFLIKQNGEVLSGNKVQNQINAIEKTDTFKGLNKLTPKEEKLVKQNLSAINTPSTTAKPKPPVAPKPQITIDGAGNVTKKVEKQFPKATDSLIKKRKEMLLKAFPELDYNPVKPATVNKPTAPQTSNSIGDIPNTVNKLNSHKDDLAKSATLPNLNKLDSRPPKPPRVTKSEMLLSQTQIKALEKQVDKLLHLQKNVLGSKLEPFVGKSNNLPNTNKNVDVSKNGVKNSSNIEKNLKNSKLSGSTDSIPPLNRNFQKSRITKYKNWFSNKLSNLKRKFK